jgi:hybrid polyketide synthase / nonribosomal peptide synthetase ACE1
VPVEESLTVAETDAPIFLPFSFSAASEDSLAAYLVSFSEYLEKNPSVNLRDLAWTLSVKRSKFAFRCSFSAATVEGLRSKIDEYLTADADKGSNPTESARVLGVFTGQGAQWASMGRDLMRGSTFVRESIKGLERVLSELPSSDRPSWSLEKELCADAAVSNINQTSISQPLCTAIQIVLVDLLCSAGVSFAAIVGHSSGEIAAAYAAGFISAEAAMQIAYYRGLHSRSAGVPGSEEKEGGMLAVTTSLEDAQEFCELAEFEGRLVVAAVNSPSSITISGDMDAIQEAKFVFEDEGKFARALKVDKAYHSHHMIPCSDPYLNSLHASNIQVRNASETAPPWFSSVSAKQISVADGLAGAYWNDNMANPVLFAQSIEMAIAKEGPFNIAFEIGAHPALQGPTLQTIQQISGNRIPYSGLLRRGCNDIEAFTDAIGFAWNNFSTDMFLTLEDYHQLISGDSRPKLLKNLPSYSWDHERIYWQESRLSRAIRLRNDPVHELLGILCPDGTEQVFRWRNLLKPKEVPWLNGHKLQGQTVFPAAGYVVLALEAAQWVARERHIKMIEVLDLNISRPLTFEDETSGVETLFTISITNGDSSSQDSLQASFDFHSLPSKKADFMIRLASGGVHVKLGSEVDTVLPTKLPPAPNVVPVDTDHFYSCLSNLGYEYSGYFRGLHSLERTIDSGRGLVKSAPTPPSQKPLLVHPAMLDSAFQATFLAFCWPVDGRLWSLHVPTTIRSIKVNPSLCLLDREKENVYSFDSVLSESGASSVSGDVGVYAWPLYKSRA